MKHTFTFFSHIVPEVNDTVELNQQESHHAIKVLRLSVGRQIILINGSGIHAIASISSVTNNVVKATIIDKRLATRNTFTRLIVSIKDFNRLCILTEKGCELNMYEMVLTNHVSENKLIRLNNILLSAAKQSKNCFIPKVIVSSNYTVNDNITNILADPSGVKLTDIKSNITNERNVWIGPEHGFSTQTIDNLTRKNFLKVCLGPTTLRTETAAIAILSQLLLL